jgi:hypothetical protein
MWFRTEGMARTLPARFVPQRRTGGSSTSSTVGGTLGIYKVARDGSLTKTGSVTGLRAFDGINGMQGLAVA